MSLHGRRTRACEDPGGRLLSGSGTLCTRRAASLPSSIEPELAVDGAQLCWPKQGLVGHPHAKEWPVQVGTPERQELVELGKARGQVILLPDELLQERAVVGHAVENAGRGQAIALQLTRKVT